MIAVLHHGRLVEVLPFDAMVSAARWLIGHGYPMLASILWREGEEIGAEEESELRRLGNAQGVPPEVEHLRGILRADPL